MTKKNSRPNNPKRGTNPTMPNQLKLVRQPRPKVNFDGQMLHGAQTYQADITLVNIASHLIWIDCSNTTAVSAPQRQDGMAMQLAGITGNYEEYIYRSAKLEWLPFVSPGVIDGGSRVYIGYTDNPEVLSNASGASAGTMISIAKGLRNMKFFNAWERFTYNVPLTSRLKVFNVNTNNTYGVDLTERAVQGAVIIGFESPGASVSLGLMRGVYDIELRNLSTNTTT